MFDNGGAVIRTRTELLAMGMSSRDLTRAVAGSALVRVRRGLYALPNTPDSVIRAVRIGGRLACVSVLQAAGVFVFEAPFPHVHLARSASRSRSPGNRRRALTHFNRDGCELHWRHLVHDIDSAEHRVGALDAVIQSVLCQSPSMAVATIDSAVHTGFIRADQLDLVFFHLPRRVQYLRDLVEPRSESGLESAFRLILVDLGIPFEVQVGIPGVGRVDFVLAGRIVVETDGRGFHGQEVSARDYDRDLALIARGYVVIRVSYRQVFFDEAAVRDALSAAMRWNRTRVS